MKWIVLAFVLAVFMGGCAGYMNQRQDGRWLECPNGQKHCNDIPLVDEP